jgi:hypothetical protein
MRSFSLLAALLATSPGLQAQAATCCTVTITAQVPEGAGTSPDEQPAVRGVARRRCAVAGTVRPRAHRRASTAIVGSLSAPGRETLGYGAVC